MKSIFIIILSNFLTGCSLAKDGSRYEVTLIELLANAEQFHGKKVNVSGVFAEAQSVGWSLYLDQGSYDNRVNINSLIFNAESMNKVSEQRLLQFKGKYIAVHGVFYKSESRKYQKSGVLSDIEYIVSYPLLEGESIDFNNLKDHEINKEADNVIIIN